MVVAARLPTPLGLAGLVAVVLDQTVTHSTAGASPTRVAALALAAVDRLDLRANRAVRALSSSDTRWPHNG